MTIIGITLPSAVGWGSIIGNGICGTSPGWGACGASGAGAGIDGTVATSPSMHRAVCSATSATGGPKTPGASGRSGRSPTSGAGTGSAMAGLLWCGALAARRAVGASVRPRLVFGSKCILRAGARFAAQGRALGPGQRPGPRPGLHGPVLLGPCEIWIVIVDGAAVQVYCIVLAAALITLFFFLASGTSDPTRRPLVSPHTSTRGLRRKNLERALSAARQTQRRRARGHGTPATQKISPRPTTHIVAHVYKSGQPNPGRALHDNPGGRCAGPGRPHAVEAMSDIVTSSTADTWRSASSTPKRRTSTEKAAAAA